MNNHKTITLEYIQKLVIENAKPVIEEFGHACEQKGGWSSYEAECYDFTEVVEQLDEELKNAAIDHGKFRVMVEKSLTEAGYHMNPDPDVSLIEAAEYIDDMLPCWLHDCDKPLFDWNALFGCLNPNNDLNQF